MVSEGADDLVRQYMSRLEREAGALPADRRADLLSGISEHIAEARAVAAADDAASARAILERLGSPGELVAAELDELGVRRVPTVVAPVPGTGRELAAVLMLTIGSLVVPLIGWLVGVTLLWTSPWWKTREKWMATLVWPGGWATFLFLLTFPATSCTGEQDITIDGVVHNSVSTCEGFTLPSWSAIPIGLLLFGAPLVLDLVLYQRARRRAAAALQAQTMALSSW
jgi:hypothetical protein